MIVINGRFRDGDSIHVEKILQIEDHVFAVADAFIHAESLLFDDLPFVQLIPEDAVVQVRRAAQHLVREILTAQDPALFDGTLLGNVLTDDAVKVTDDQLHRMRFHFPDEQLGRFHRQPVVHIHELNVAADCLGQTAVAGGRRAPVCLVDRLHPCVLPGIVLHDLQRGIPAPVVHQDQLEVGIILHQNAVHAALQTLFSVVYGYDDADFIHG